MRMNSGGAAARFVYGGLPGEPAFRSARIHAPAGRDDEPGSADHPPLARLDPHHFGVITAGWVQDDWKFEASQFTGREPDEDRYDIERPRLDSTSLRASWNPGRTGRSRRPGRTSTSPEQLEPAVDEERLSASALYGHALDGGRSWSATFAWGHKNPSEGESTDALALEAAGVPRRTGRSSLAPSGSKPMSSAWMTTRFTRSRSSRSALGANSRSVNTSAWGWGALQHQRR
jgi:hypothetical protein